MFRSLPLFSVICSSPLNHSHSTPTFTSRTPLSITGAGRALQQHHQHPLPADRSGNIGAMLFASAVQVAGQNHSDNPSPPPMWRRYDNADMIMQSAAALRIECMKQLYIQYMLTIYVYSTYTNKMCMLFNYWITQQYTYI